MGFPSSSLLVGSCQLFQSFPVYERFYFSVLHEITLTVSRQEVKSKASKDQKALFKLACTTLDRVCYIVAFRLPAEQIFQDFPNFAPSCRHDFLSSTCFVPSSLKDPKTLASVLNFPRALAPLSTEQLWTRSRNYCGSSHSPPKTKVS